MTILQAREPQSAPPTPSEGRSPDRGAPGPLYQAWAKLPEGLARLTAARAAAEEACRSIHQARVARADAALREALGAADRLRGSNAADLAAEVASTRARANGEFDEAIATAEAERQTMVRTTKARFRNIQEKARAAHDSARWETGTIFENAEKGAAEWRKETEATLADEAQLIEVLRAETDLVAHRYRGYLSRNSPSPPAPLGDPPAGDPFPRLRLVVEEADANLLKLESLKLPRAFQGPKMIWVALLPLMALGYPCWRYLGNTAGPVAAVVLSAAIGYGLRRWIISRSRTSILDRLNPLRRELSEASQLLEVAASFIRETHRQRMLEATTRRDREMARAEEARQQTVEAATIRRDERLREAEDSARRRVEEVTVQRDALLLRAAETDRVRGREIVEQHAAEQSGARAKHQAEIAEADSRRDASWNALAHAWSSGMADALATVDSIRGETDCRFPAWPAMPPTVQAADLPEAIRFGEIRLRLDRMAGGLPDDPRLKPMAPETITVPALAGFPEHASIAFEFPDEAGRKAAIEGMQAVILRFLTGLPAGRVRLTILDPMGLGRNFAGFMHLADYSEALVNTRIWTEPQQIDARLSELNVHVELVIQNYLRNEYPTIESYNVQAAEVAEPYRILVVPDFPAGFNESTARRLLAIAKSGPRCGVYVVLGLDTSATIPPR